MAVCKRKRDGNRETITLSGDLTVVHAHEMRSALQEAVQSAEAITVVLDRITNADVTFLQLLCSAHRSAAALQKILCVRGVEVGPVSLLLRNTGFQRQVGCRELSGTDCLWRCAEGQRERTGADDHDRC